MVATAPTTIAAPVPIISHILRLSGLKNSLPHGPLPASK